MEFGQYPQQAASIEMEEKLERLYDSGVLELCETKNSYTTDSYYDYKNSFMPKQHIEYEYKRKKYVRVITNLEEKVILSNGREYNNGDVAWIEVQPIKWLIDAYDDIAITEKLIFSGIQFDNKKYYDGNFTKSNINQFINNIFSIDIIPPQIELKQNDSVSYNLQPETRKPRIIEANILHKEGSNITIVLPYEELENIDTITLESKIGEEKQVVYKKIKRNRRIKL